MTIKIDSNLQDMIISALRYAIGKKSYITGQTADFIMKNPNLIDSRVKKIMIKDLRNYLENRIDLYNDDDIDFQKWRQLYNWIKSINC